MESLWKTLLELLLRGSQIFLCHSVEKSVNSDWPQILIWVLVSKLWLKVKIYFVLLRISSALMGIAIVRTLIVKIFATWRSRSSQFAGSSRPTTQQLLLCNNATFDDIILQHLMTSFVWLAHFGIWRHKGKTVFDFPKLQKIAPVCLIWLFQLTLQQLHTMKALFYKVINQIPLNKKETIHVVYSLLSMIG